MSGGSGVSRFSGPQLELRNATPASAQVRAIFPSPTGGATSAEKAQTLNLRLFARTKAAGVLRADIEATDIALVFEQLAAIRVRDPQRTDQLRHRYLALILDSLRAHSTTALPGPVPTWEEINGRWG